MQLRTRSLDFINDVITANGGEVGTEDTVVVDSGIDSFGYSLFFLELDDEFDCFSNEYIKTVSDERAQSLTIGDVIDRIEQCS